MRNLPVDWSEGMFLRPHHLQAAERYWTETIHTSGQWDHQYNYGIRTLEISPEALLNFQFQINTCQARLRDGTLVSLGLGQGPDRLDLKPALEQQAKADGLKADLKAAFQSQPSVTVYLAVPRLKMGAANVADQPGATPHRFHRLVHSLQDETAGGNDQEINLRQLSVRLLLSTESLEGYECLPLAQIQRAGDQDATPRINEKYIPPLLAVDASPTLHLDIVRAIYDIVGNTIERFSDVVRNRGITLVSQEPGDLDRLLMLSQLNEAYSTLSVLAFALGVHPLISYTELCRLVGKLSIFGNQRKPPTIPQYDHDDLAGIFYWVKQQIELLLRSIAEDEYKQRYFIGAGLGMQVTLDPVWLNNDWKWFVGVARGDITEQECRDVLSAGQLHWKLGSVRQVEIIFREGREGLLLVPVAHTPRALPGKGWVYYEVGRQNEAWRDVQETQSLAMRLRDALIMNRQSLKDERRLIVNYKGRQIGLEFALFAVRGAA